MSQPFESEASVGISKGKSVLWRRQSRSTACPHHSMGNVTHFGSSDVGTVRYVTSGWCPVELVGNIRGGAENKLKALLW